MGSLLVVTGPPSAGKSTVSRILGGRFDPSVVVEGDAFFAFLASGAIPPWLPEANAQNEVVTRAAASATGRYSEGEYMTVYDGMVGPWFLPTFLAATGLNNLDYVVLQPSIERCLTRVAERQGHGFTDQHATRHMHQQFAQSDINRRHVFVDPPDQPARVADLILAALTKGSLRYPHGR
jgi:cytidylate kinase